VSVSTSGKRVITTFRKIERTLFLFSEVTDETPWQVTQGLAQRNPATAVRIEAWINRHDTDAVENKGLA